MKKIVATVVVLQIAALSAYAAININWATGTAGIVDQLGTPLSDGSLVQLIWTPVSGPQAFDPFNPTTPQGDQILLQDSGTQFGGLIIDGGTGNITSGSLGLTSAELLAGYVFTRAFSSDNPTIGDFYNDGGFAGGPLNNALAVPNPGPNDSDASGMMTSIEIIPEPSVLAMMSLGGFLVMLRRRRMVM